jgi:hypothetical protein
MDLLHQLYLPFLPPEAHKVCKLSTDMTLINITQWLLYLPSVSIITNTHEIWGSHSSEGVDAGLLGCTTFRAKDLKMEAVCSSKMLVSTYKSTWHYNPEEKHWRRIIQFIYFQFNNFIYPSFHSRAKITSYEYKSEITIHNVSCTTIICTLHITVLLCGVNWFKWKFNERMLFVGIIRSLSFNTT